MLVAGCSTRAAEAAASVSPVQTSMSSAVTYNRSCEKRTFMSQVQITACVGKELGEVQQQLDPDLATEARVWGMTIPSWSRLAGSPTGTRTASTSPVQRVELPQHVLPKLPARADGGPAGGSQGNHQAALSASVPYIPVRASDPMCVSRRRWAGPPLDRGPPHQRAQRGGVQQMSLPMPNRLATLNRG